MCLSYLPGVLLLQGSVGQSSPPPKNADDAEVVEGEQREGEDHREEEIGDILVIENVVLVEPQIRRSQLVVLQIR